MPNVTKVRNERVDRINYSLAIFQISIHLYLFFFVPIYFSTSPALLFFNALVLGIFFSNQLWAIIHEGIHGFLSSNKKVNNLLFSALAICFGSSSAFLKAIHYFHHRYSRSHTEKVEIYSTGEGITKVTFLYYYNLIMGLYLSELLMPLISFLPKIVLRSLKASLFKNSQQLPKMIDYFLNHPEEHTLMRCELSVVLVVYSGTFYLFAGHWYVMLAFILSRGFLISFLDYVYHYETPLGNNLHGKNLELPTLISKFLLHFNLHGIHHQNPKANWMELKRIFIENKTRYDAHYFSAATAQLKGPVHEDHLPKADQ